MRAKQGNSEKELNMDAVPEKSSVSPKERATFPRTVRRAIGVHAGDKVPFVRRDDGAASPLSQSMVAMRATMDAIAGAAKKAGIDGDEDLSSLVREARAKMWAEREADVSA